MWDKGRALADIRVTLLVRPQHSLNSSDGGVVPSVKVRLCLVTVTMFHLERKAYKIKLQPHYKATK